jgi:hypothetical protein
LGATLAGGGHEMTVHPGELEVSAAVDVTFLVEEK